MTSLSILLKDIVKLEAELGRFEARFGVKSENFGSLGFRVGRPYMGVLPIRQIGDSPRCRGKDVGIELRPEGCRNSAA